MSSAIPVRRIAVIGNAGTGKSTLAREIGRMLAIEVFHLDAMLWRPAWRMVPEAEFARRHAELIGRPSWVIDGLGHPATLAARIAAADAVIFTRYGLWRCYWWSLKRELRPSRAAGRPAGCAMLPALGRLVRAIRLVQRETLPEIDRLLARQPPGKIVRVLGSPRALPRLIEEVGGWRGEIGLSGSGEAMVASPP